MTRKITEIPSERANRFRVAHLTSVHSALDDRIFYRECLTLSKAGFDVTIIAPGKVDQVIDNIKVKAIPLAANRLQRVTGTVWKVYRAAVREDADIYHFHDPELIPVAFLLRNRGKAVIYDVHEDVPEDVLTKQWIPLGLRPSIARTMISLHALAARRFSAVVSATEKIAKRFEPIVSPVIHNYPLTSELESGPTRPFADRHNTVAYVGSITAIRGIGELVEAIGRVAPSFQASVTLCGQFENSKLEQEMQQKSGWSKVNFLGWRDRHEVSAALSNSKAGIVLFHPGPNHTEALPAKIFEYMGAGLPVIASNFPLWRTIIEETGSGILVDPLDVRAITNAIEFVLAHPEEASAMGMRGKAAVHARFNWDREADKLLRVYEHVL